MKISDGTSERAPVEHRAEVGEHLHRGDRAQDDGDLHIGPVRGVGVALIVVMLDGRVGNRLGVLGGGGVAHGKM